MYENPYISSSNGNVQIKLYQGLYKVSIYCTCLKVVKTPIYWVIWIDSGYFGLFWLIYVFVMAAVNRKNASLTSAWIFPLIYCPP